MPNRFSIIVALSTGVMVASELFAGPREWAVDSTPVIGDGATDWPAAGGSFVKVGDLYQSWHNDGRAGQDNVIYAQSSDPLSWPNWGTPPDGAGVVYSPLSQDGFHDAVVRNGVYYYWVGAENTNTSVLTSPDGYSDGSGGEMSFAGYINGWTYKAMCATDGGFEAWYNATGNLDCYHHALLGPDGVTILTDPPDNCVLSADTGAGESFAAFDVVCGDNGYQMWYVSSISGMSYATSGDGINWTKEGACSGFDGFTPGEFTVIPDGTTLRMWFAQGHRSEYYAEASSIEPIPTVSEWGMVVLTLLLLAGLTLVFRARRWTLICRIPV